MKRPHSNAVEPFLFRYFFLFRSVKLNLIFFYFRQDLRLNSSSIEFIIVATFCIYWLPRSGLPEALFLHLKTHFSTDFLFLKSYCSRFIKVVQFSTVLNHRIQIYLSKMVQDKMLETVQQQTTIVVILTLGWV